VLLLLLLHGFVAAAHGRLLQRRPRLSPGLHP